jgi:phosphoserine aminotransferase
MGVPKGYQVFFFAGGASLQFSALPMNLLKDKTKANYLTTGAWSEAAIKEAKKYCNAIEVWPDSGSKYTTIPDVSKWNID